MATLFTLFFPLASTITPDCSSYVSGLHYKICNYSSAILHSGKSLSTTMEKGKGEPLTW